MRNKYRLSIMIVLIIILFMYITGVVGLADETNFAFTLAALILSISMVVDTFAKQNKIAEGISFVLEVLTLLIIVMIPNLKDFVILKKLMSILDTNVLLMLALFFTFAGQWATEIKIKDIENRKRSKMYTSDEKYEVILNSAVDINMSNWQITKTLDTMTMVNNKFVILSNINNLLNEGVNKKDIFVTDKSFLISTNYKTYFEKGNRFFGGQNDIVKMYSLGRLISMEPNEDIYKINCLFEFYKKLNSITNKYLKCRIRSIYLSDSFSVLFNGSVEQAYEILLDGAKEQVYNVFERYISPDTKRRDMIITNLESQKEPCLRKNRNRFEKIMRESSKKFAYTYNRFDRPIVGIYHQDGHSIEIINADQMYKNGEESDTQIKLKQITKNSPVAIALLVTGPMVGFLGYLLYREHKVNNQMDEQDIFDIPQDDEEAISNIIGNDDGNLIDSGNVREVDSQVKELAQCNLNKLEIVTNKRVVHLEMNIESKIDIVVK